MSGTYAVTGCATGIGAGLAAILKDRGHRVIGFDLHDAPANVDQWIPIDLDDPAAIVDAVDKLDTKLDGLCIIAGLPLRAGLEEKLFQLNFLGQREFFEAIAPSLLPGSSVSNMASRAGAA